MLISVHLPKTGGSSFGTLLKSVYGEGLLVDSNDHPMAHGTLARNLAALRQMPAARKLEGRYRCVHGHFLPLKYALLKHKSYAIWLRDPVERVVSRYFHRVRNLARKDGETRQYLGKRETTLEEFVQLPHHQNLYAKYLFGMRLEQFDFVGITETYETSLQVFSRCYDIDVDTAIDKQNANPRKRGERYEISDELRSLIVRNNQKDQRLYEKALLISASLQRKYLA